jgi:hypothetical protein
MFMRFTGRICKCNRSWLDKQLYLDSQTAFFACVGSESAGPAVPSKSCEHINQDRLDSGSPAVDNGHRGKRSARENARTLSTETLWPGEVEPPA